MYEKLFEPIMIAKMEVKNRFVVPAMGVSLGNDDGTVSQRLINYWVERARGDFGLCTIEFSCVSAEGKALPGQLMIDADDKIAGMRQLAQAIHDNGAKASLQLHHAGRSTMSAITGRAVIAPSAIPCHQYGHFGSLPLAMTKEQIEKIIDQFVQAAIRAKTAGFDAVELHAGHSYLLAQFLSPAMNKRVDDFGGDLLGRAKILVTIIKTIKQLLGKAFPVLVKFSVEDNLEEGNLLIDSCRLACLLEQSGADGLVVSTGSYGHMEKMVASANQKPGFNLFHAQKIKTFVDIPVIGIGRINTPDLADMALRHQMCDLVALGRASIAEPAFPKKVKENQVEEIAPCIACMQRCQGERVGRPGANCLVNPFGVCKADWAEEAAAVSKQVIIVGAGVAGMQAAWILAKRGHQVNVIEQNSEPGGQMHTAAMPPYKQDFIKTIQYYWTMGKKYGVTYQFATLAKEETILEAAPDVVIMATGSKPMQPMIEGIGECGAVFANDILEGRVLAGHKCLILGGGLVGMETADYLADYGKQVTIVEKMAQLPNNEGQAIGFYRQKRFREHGVQILMDCTITRMEKGVIFCRQQQQTLRLEAETLVLALGVKPERPFDLTGKVKEFYWLGDCLQPKNALQAIYDATELAIKI